MDEKVKDYIDKQDKNKKEIILACRQLILKTLPESKEEYAWGVAVYDDGKFYLGAMKERVHFQDLGRRAGSHSYASSCAVREVSSARVRPVRAINTSSRVVSSGLILWIRAPELVRLSIN